MLTGFGQAVCHLKRKLLLFVFVAGVLQGLLKMFGGLVILFSGLVDASCNRFAFLRRIRVIHGIQGQRIHEVIVTCFRCFQGAFLAVAAFFILIFRIIQKSLVQFQSLSMVSFFSLDGSG